MSSPAIAVELTANRKTGPVHVTMASQASCPSTCPLLHSGCYAESGPQGFQTARVNRSSARDPKVIARAEAQAIKGLSGDRPMRLHVVGDASTSPAARILSRAVDKWKHPVWSYTHAWRKVKRIAWGKVSILASCETTADVKSARDKGYATALVVDRFQSTKAYTVDGVKVIPCPAQTHEDVQCTSCKLCWNDGRLRAMNATIAFEAHGSGAKKTRAKLELIQIGGLKVSSD